MAHVKENERSLDNRDTTSAVTKTSGDTSCAALNENDSKTSDLPKEFYWYVTKKQTFYFLAVRFNA